MVNKTNYTCFSPVQRGVTECHHVGAGAPGVQNKGKGGHEGRDVAGSPCGLLSNQLDLYSVSLMLAAATASQSGPLAPPRARFVTKWTVASPPPPGLPPRPGAAPGFIP